MGGPGSGRFPKKMTGTHLGNGHKHDQAPNRANRDGVSVSPRVSNRPDDIRDIGEFGVKQPAPSRAWNNIVQAWWRALGKSALAQIAQPADWMYAWVAADLLQYMYDISGFQAGLMQNWVVMADKLHAPHFEQLDLPDGAAEPVDEDKERAAAKVADIQKRFKVV